MRKIHFYLLLIVGLFVTLYSCDNAKTPQEYLREEKKAVDRFISRNDIKVLKEYPADGVFQENEYFRTPDGLYIHVVDSGNGKRVRPHNSADSYRSTVLVRFDYYLDVKSYVSGDTTKYSLGYAYLPIEFKYGIPGSYGDLACNGWAVPLSYVGEEAIVDLIIPSSLGASSHNSAYRAIFYKNLKYTRFD